MNTLRQIFYSAAKELRQRKWALISYSAISVGFVWLYVAIFPSFAKESEKFNELLKSYPKALLEAFNITQLQMSNIEGYISAEHFSFIWPLMAILLGLSTAGIMLAGEIERGTANLLLSLPVSRTKQYIGKYFAGSVLMLIFVVLSTVSIIPFTRIYDISISQSHIATTTILCWAFAQCIFSIGYMFSAMFKERSHVYFVSAGILMMMYVANIVSGLVDSLEKVKYISLFHYFSPDKALVNGEISGRSLLVFFGLSIITAVIGFVVFRSRDI